MSCRSAAGTGRVRRVSKLRFAAAGETRLFASLTRPIGCWALAGNFADLLNPDKQSLSGFLFLGRGKRWASEQLICPALPFPLPKETLIVPYQGQQSGREPDRSPGLDPRGRVKPPPRLASPKDPKTAGDPSPKSTSANNAEARTS